MNRPWLVVSPTPETVTIHRNSGEVTVSNYPCINKLKTDPKYEDLQDDVDDITVFDPADERAEKNSPSAVDLLPTKVEDLNEELKFASTAVPRSNSSKTIQFYKYKHNSTIPDA